MTLAEPLKDPRFSTVFGRRWCADADARYPAATICDDREIIRKRLAPITRSRTFTKPARRKPLVVGALLLDLRDDPQIGPAVLARLSGRPPDMMVMFAARHHVAEHDPEFLLLPV